MAGFDKKSFNKVVKDIQPVLGEQKILDKAIQGAKIAGDQFKTIGSHLFNGGFDATQFTKGIDPQNLSGTVKFGLELIQQLKGKGAPFQLIEGMIGGNLQGLIQKFTQMLQQKLDVSKIEDMIHQATSKLNGAAKEILKTPQEIEALVSEAKQLLEQVKQGVA